MNIDKSYVVVVLTLFLSLLSCDLNRNKPDESQLESDHECVLTYEKIAKEFQQDSILNYVVRREKFITADENHKLMSTSYESEKNSCGYRGLRDYGNVTVVEISSWKFFPDRYSNLQIDERHLLLVGEWKDFDINQLLWRKNEKIVHKEVIGNNSKLIVTHISWYATVPGK